MIPETPHTRPMIQVIFLGEEGIFIKDYLFEKLKWSQGKVNPRGNIVNVQ